MQEENSKLKLAIVGSSEFQDRDLIYQFLDKNYAKIDCIIVAGTDGISAFALEWCKERGFVCVIHFPQYYNFQFDYIKGAKFNSNIEIVKAADCVCVWRVNMSRGASHFVELSNHYGKKLKLFDYGNEKES